MTRNQDKPAIVAVSRGLQRPLSEQVSRSTRIRNNTRRHVSPHTSSKGPSLNSYDLHFPRACGPQIFLNVPWSYIGNWQGLRASFSLVDTLALTLRRSVDYHCPPTHSVRTSELLVT